MSIENFEKSMDEVAGTLLGSSKIFEDIWAQIVLLTVQATDDDDATKQINAIRPNLVEVFNDRLKIMVDANQLKNDPEGTLSIEIERMMEFKKKVLDYWETVDDLFELAARDYPLDIEALKKYAQDHPPPQAWYDEDSKPF